MKKILGILMLVCFIGLTSAGSEQVVNKTAVDSLIDDPVYVDGVFMNGTWNGVWQIAQPWGYKKGDNITNENLPDELLEYFYYTRYFEDPVIETPSKPDGSTCLVQWVCENGDWIKTDWIHWKIPFNCEKDKMIFNSYSNKMVMSEYNERNCEHSKNYYTKVIPGEKCFVLNDNGIGLKEKPTESCAVETIQEEVEEQETEVIIEQPKKKGFWNWLKSLFS